jgi:hypothetical protein
LLARLARAGETAGGSPGPRVGGRGSAGGLGAEVNPPVRARGCPGRGGRLPWPPRGPAASRTRAGGGGGRSTKGVPGFEGRGWGPALWVALG